MHLAGEVPLLGVLALALSVLALGVGVSQGLAGARADGSATVPVLKGADPFVQCPPSGGKVIGRAQFELKSHTLRVRIQLHGADPGKYFVALWTAENPCGWTDNLYGDFNVDASGEGSVAFSATVSGATLVHGRTFFVDVFNSTTGQSNGSAVANL